MRFIGCLFIFCFIFFSTYAQQPENKGIEEVAIEFPVLPPLSVMIDSAMARSPQKLILEKQKVEKELSLRMTKRELLQYVKIGGTYSYGKGGVIGVSQDGLSVPTAILTNNTTNQYTTSLSMGITLGAIMDHKSKVKLAKIQVDKANDELLQVKDEIALKICDEYTKLQLSLVKLKNALSQYSSYHAELVMAEKQYANNLMKFEQLVTVRSSYSSSLDEVEQLKRDCRNAVFYLERITGVSIGLIK